MLGEVNLIKKKIYGTIKGTTCANGSKKIRYLIEAESIASPTVSLEELFIVLIIGAHKERDVATFDVAGAYLYVDIP